VSNLSKKTAYKVFAMDGIVHETTNISAIGAWHAVNIGKLGYDEHKVKAYWNNHDPNECAVTIDNYKKMDVFTLYHTLKNDLPQVPLSAISEGIRDYKSKVSDRYAEIAKSLTSAKTNNKLKARMLASYYVEHEKNEILSGGQNAERFKKTHKINPILENEPQFLENVLYKILSDPEKTPKQTLNIIYRNTFFPKKRKKIDNRQKEFFS
jgi:hypothetical protein